jgi:hypothetical protein
MNPTTSIPLARDNERQLLALRRRLERVFTDLHLIHDVTSICKAAFNVSDADITSQVSNVLRRGVSYQVDNQMEELTSIIEQLGGRTLFSESEDPVRRSQSESEARNEK